MSNQPTAGLYSWEHRAPCGPCLLWVGLLVGNPTTTVLYSTVWQWGACELLCLCVPPLPGMSTTHHPALHPWEGTYAQAPESRPVGGHHGSAFPSVSTSRLWRLSSTGTTVRTCLPTRLVVGSLALRWQCRTKIKNGFIRSLQLKCLWAVLLALDVRMSWETCEEHTAIRHFQGWSSPQPTLWSVCQLRVKHFCIWKPHTYLKEKEQKRQKEARKKNRCFVLFFFLCWCKCKSNDRQLWKVSLKTLPHTFSPSLPSV